jgi:hypothetical protein
LERVVAQVEDELLGGERLAGRPGRALRLAAAALGACAQVEQALPAEVLDRAEAEHVGVRVGLLEVEHLAVAAHGLERPEGVGTAGEHDVERGEADVQVLGVGDDDQEGQHDAELEQDEGGLEDAVDAVAEGVQRLGDDPGGERPGARVREHARVHLRASVDQQRHDDRADHGQDHPGGPCVRAGEAGGAALLTRVVAEPDDRERDDAGQHADGEQVLDEPDGRPVPDARDRERAGEQVAVRLDDRQQQDDESPERRRVGRAGDRPLQQLALADHVVSWVSASRPGCDLAYASRSGAGCPVNASRLSHHSRLPAIANAAVVSTRPTIMRKTMDAPVCFFCSADVIPGPVPALP